MGVPECGVEICHEPATHRVYWPGQTIDQCERHMEIARGIADGMGLALTIEPLER